MTVESNYVIAIATLRLLTNFTQIMADACTPSPSEESDSNESVGLSSSNGFSKCSSDSSEDDSRSGLGKPAAPSRKWVCYQSPEGAKGRVRLVGLKQANTLSGQKMEDLAAWVTSEEEASPVEREIRSKLLDSPRISFSEGSKRMKRPKPSSSRRASIEEELKIVDCHILKDKSSISENLKNLDEGNLTFPKHELLPW